MAAQIMMKVATKVPVVGGYVDKLEKLEIYLLKRMMEQISELKMVMVLLVFMMLLNVMQITMLL